MTFVGVRGTRWESCGSLAAACRGQAGGPPTTSARAPEQGTQRAGQGVGRGGGRAAGFWLRGPAEDAGCRFVRSAPWVLEAWLEDRPGPAGSIHPAPSPSALTSGPWRPSALPAAPAASWRRRAVRARAPAGGGQAVCDLVESGAAGRQEMEDGVQHQVRTSQQHREAGLPSARASAVWRSPGPYRWTGWTGWPQPGLGPRRAPGLEQASKRRPCGPRLPHHSFPPTEVSRSQPRPRSKALRP